MLLFLFEKVDLNYYLCLIGLRSLCFPPPVLPGSGSLGRQHLAILSAESFPAPRITLMNKEDGYKNGLF